MLLLAVKVDRLKNQIFLMNSSKLLPNNLILFFLSIIVTFYWLLRLDIIGNAYNNNFLTNLLYSLNYIMWILIIILPLISIIKLRHEKFQLKSLNYFSLLLLAGTIIVMFIEMQPVVD